MSQPAGLAALALLCLIANPRFAAGAGREDPLAVRPADRVSGSLNDAARVVLAGQRHPLARPEFAVGQLPPGQRLDHLVLLLRPDEDQQRALDALIQSQQDPTSPLYHQWLTPESFG